MHLQEALSQISEIRTQIARTETFRGYRALTVAFSGGMAITAGLIQAIWIPEPTQNTTAWLSLWIGAAVISLLVVSMQLAWGCYRSTSGWTLRQTRQAVEQFLPCLLAGGLVTFSFVMYAPEQLWMLPGLWAILFSLGVFASSPLLPRPCYWVGAFYLIAGILVLGFAQGAYALSPWAMSGVFGLGQFATATLLYFTLERSSLREIPHD